MSKPWQATFVNMCSMTGRESVMSHFESCLRYYKATDADCSMSNEQDAYNWQAPIKFHYTLTLHTYVGWKVYMLMTGCLASKPEYEDPNAAEFPAEVEIPGCEW
jgi:hypothetical protein